MRRIAAVVALAGLLLAACARAGPGTGSDGPHDGSGPTNLDAPPPVIVTSPARTLELDAWAYCYGNVCADGFPPERPERIGDAEDQVVEFPLEDWSFTATFRPAGDRCGREQRVPLEEIGDGRFALEPAGLAGTYDVTLFGQGGGDLVVTFRWTTPRDGPLPEPEARLAVLTDHDGEVDSYGVELELTNLATTPEDVTATITVRSETGEEVSFEAVRSRLTCLPEGTAYWDGPDAKGLAAAALGEGPFTYEVELVIDGVRHVATASWPRDEILGNEPSVALRFAPELPALG